MMTFQSPAFTVFAIVFYAAVALTVATMVAGAAAFVVTNRRERLARHEDFRTYYGHLVLAH